MAYEPTHPAYDPFGAVVLAQAWLDTAPEDPTLRMILAEDTYYGWTQAPDAAMALAQYIQIADETGYAFAAVRAGYALANGDGVPVDVPVAVEYLELAARGENPQVFGLLAQIYYTDGAEPRDVNAARGYAVIGVSMGDGLSHLLLGEMLLTAMGWRSTWSGRGPSSRRRETRG